jgi:hypothetical protein
VAEFVSTEKQSLKMQERKPMIHPGEPLGHAVVISVFCPERKLKPAARKWFHPPTPAAQTPIRPNLAQFRIAICNKPAALIAVFEDVGLDNL